MKKSMLHSFPLNSLDVDPVRESFSKIGKAISARDYDQAIDFATATIDAIQQSLLYTTLSHRAHALAMKGKFEKAIEDAERAISLDPTSLVGYVSLGECYSMQGKQSEAIHTYKTCLKNVPLDDREVQFLSYLESRAKGSKLWVRDPVTTLPNELVDLIIAQLPQESMCTCLSVSRTWRKRVLRSSKAWATLAMVNQNDSNQITSILPHIAPYVERLNMDTENRDIWSHCLLSLGSGSFEKLKRLSLTVNEPWYTLVEITGALDHARSALTRLELNLCADQTGFTLANILSTFFNLKYLTYTADFEDALSDFFGDFTHLEVHNFLQDLQVKVNRIETEAIEPLLQRCQQIRRLVLHGHTHDDVLDAINRICPNLLILGYKSNSAITELDDLDISDGELGLRQIYTEGCGFGVSPSHLLPLMRKNMRTLKVLNLNFSTSVQQMTDLGPYFDDSENAYGDLMMDNLEYLLYCTDPNYTLDSIILRSISMCRSLRFFGTVGSPRLDAITDTLMTLPPVQHLEVSHTEEIEAADESLIRLFEYYASHSRNAETPQTVCLQNSKSVTDAVLDAVANIETMKRVALWNFDNVSAEGLDMFLKQICDRATYINLSELAIVTNDHVITLGSMRYLEEVKLQELPNVTDHGLTTMIEHATALERLTLTNCPQISQTCIAYVKLKVSQVVERDEVDYED